MGAYTIRRQHRVTAETSGFCTIYCPGLNIIFILGFINLVTTLGNSAIAVSVKDYIISILAGIAFGIGGFYLTMSLGGKAALYDFNGCSCDDCVSKCPVGSKTQMVLAKQNNLSAIQAKMGEISVQYFLKARALFTREQLSTLPSGCNLGFNYGSGMGWGWGMGQRNRF